MENLTNITLTFFIESTDINWFFSTMATASTAIIIFIIGIAIQNAFIISQDIHNKIEELYKSELELHNIKLEKEKNEKIINQLIINQHGQSKQDEDKYRHNAKLIMENNIYIYNLEQKINEIKKYLKYNKEKMKHIKLLMLKNIYMFILIFIVLPLSLLSLPNYESIIIGLNIIKILLLIILIFFIHKFMKDFKNIIDSDSNDIDTTLKSL